MGWEDKMEQARRLHRPSLKNWQRDGMYRSFPSYQRQLEASGHPDLQYPPSQDHLPVRVDAYFLAKQSPTAEAYFAQHYQVPRLPTVIRNVPQLEQWPAVRRWTLQALTDEHNNDNSSSNLSSRVFKCGEDDDGKSIKVKLKHFMQYLKHNEDDSPLYIFDTAFDEDKVAKRILQDYQVPTYFQNDLFRYVSESRRPPYRWFLVGPERSGTTIHIDPLGTSAWNTLLVGKKRWVLFPPHVPKPIVKGKGLIQSHEDDEAIHYFTMILPRILQQAKQQQAQNDPAYHDFQYYEFTQQAGETVYIPTGWWHAVLNVTHTVGCTQNFCHPTNFDAVWCQTRKGRKKMAWKWLQALREHEPALYERAVYLNQRDNFVMKYDPAQSSLQPQRPHSASPTTTTGEYPPQPRSSSHYKRKSDV